MQKGMSHVLQRQTQVWLAMYFAHCLGSDTPNDGSRCVSVTDQKVLLSSM